MHKSVGLRQRMLAGVTAVTFVATQLAYPPHAEAAHLGSATASAGSAPPPSVSAIQSFQPDLFTGRATTAIPIAVPPGRKGMQPSLALAYSSSGRNGWVGVGWSLDVGYIERNTKHGVPKYDDSDTFTFLFQGVASELVKIADGTYRAKDEGLFLKFTKTSSGWVVRDKSGTRYFFGQDAASQIVHPEGKVFRWALDEILDTNGNSLTVTYTKDQHQLYLTRIDYTAHERTGLPPANRVEFVWEGRNDVETSYRSGFAITTAKRLKEMATFAQGQLARKYLLSYTPSKLTQRSLLTAVRQVGSDGRTALPPTTFTYTQEAPTYLHCHNCVPSVSSGNQGWQLQYHVGPLFPVEDGGNDQRLWPTTPNGHFEPGIKQWSTEEECGRNWRRKKIYCQVPHVETIPPVSWSHPFLERSGSSGGISWSTDAKGNLSVSGPSDSHILAITWLYTKTAKTVSIPLGGSSRADVFYVQPGGDKWLVASNNQVPLQAGWTVVAVTAYNETGNFGLSMSANLTTEVTAMNHAQFSPMELTGDFNGDGYGDLAHVAPEDNHWHVLLNSGSGFGQEQTWLNTKPPPGTRPLVGDVNLDGKADLILWSISSGVWHVALSTGSSFQAPVTWHSGFGTGQTPFMGDFNGDQLLDVGTVKDGTWTVALSTGSSFGSATTWLSGFGAGATPLSGDFNGDGLTDVAAVSGGTVTVALSDGRHFLQQTTPWATQLGNQKDLSTADLNGDGLTDLLSYDKDTVRGTVVAVPSTGQRFGNAQRLMENHPFELTGPDDVLQVGDFRGNGLSGFGVFNPFPPGQAEIAFALGTPPDLLETIANGLGGTTTLTYQPSSQFANTQLHFTIPVVTQVDVADGLALTPGVKAEDHTYTTTYRYSGGLYDVATREFRGFNTAIVTEAVGGMTPVADPLGVTTTTTFLQDPCTKGRPLTVEVHDSIGRLYAKTTTRWTCDDPLPGVQFATLEQTDSAIYDGNDTFRKTRTRLAYDQYGNVTTTHEDGQVDPPVSGDERTSRTEYVYNTTDWILNRPRLIQTLDANGTVIAQRRFSYEATTGNLTKEEEWLNVPTEQWLATTLTYDSYGNVKTVTDALSRTTTNTYDPTGTYLVEITNTLSHTRRLTYDPRVGQVTSSTDQNGLTTKTAYDALGRTTHTSFVDPSTNMEVVTSRIDYDPCLTSALTTGQGQGGCTQPIRTSATVFTSITQSPNHSITTYQFSDGLGRSLQTRSPAEEAGKQIVSGVVELNRRGRVTKQWVPYLSNESSSYVPLSFEPSASSLASVSYIYDPIGRPIQLTDPDGSTTFYHYNDGETTIVPPVGGETTKLVDAYGRLSHAQEVVSATDRYTTAYAYDARGNLIQVKDHAGNLTRITYDSLSRKLSMDDPDMGHWSYAYDAVDNLTSQTDARGVTTTFHYDPLNRLTRKSYVVPLTSDLRPLTSVQYAYDNPAKASSKGKLTEIADGSGSSSFEYDALGRLITETKIIDGKRYTVNRSYDLLGRLTTLTYPDSDVVRYTYNPQGALETVDLFSPITQSLNHLITAVEYNAAGQLTKLVYGNGIVSDYTYHPQTLRLDRLIARSLDGSVLQDFSYTFDAVGNVTTITDRVHTASQEFWYDPLHRLLRARGAYGDLTYAYDPLGNMTRKEGAALSYGLPDGSKPHAVTSVTGLHPSPSTLHLTYDANGNLVEKAIDRGPGRDDVAAQRLSYDAENRLVEVKTGQEKSLTVDFKPGWNLFSLPVIPDDLRITAIFPTFAQDFKQLTWLSTDGGVRHFVNHPKFNQFDRLQYGQAYQIYCKNPNGVTVTFTGRLPTTPVSAKLSPGWHLLPAISIQPSAVSPIFGGIDYESLLRYDTSTSSLTTVTDVKPGEAYFVQVRTASTWRPPLPRDPTTRFVYDGDGGRVKQVVEGKTTTYLGELVELAPDGTATKYVFAGSQRIAALETTAAQRAAFEPRHDHALAKAFHQLWQALADLLDIPTAEAAQLSTALRVYLPDHLGSTNLVVDGTGKVVERTEHAPYGAITQHEGTGRVAHQFTGQRQDETTGLILFPARPYDPSLGRFLQPDPTVQRPGDPQDLNRYAYARNNPLSNVDPTGHGWFKQFWGQVVSVIIGIGVTIATGGNFVLGFQAYNLSSSLIGAGQALAAGVSPWRVAAAVGAGLAIGAVGAGMGIGNIGNLGLRMGAFAAQGAIMGASTAAIMGGDVGQGAAWGAGFGAVTGLVSSQQVANWRANGNFVSNDEYSAIQAQKLGNGPRYGMLGLYADEGHTFLGLADPEGNNVIFNGKYQGNGASGNQGTQNLQWILGKTSKGAIVDEWTKPHLGKTAKLVARYNLNDGQYTMAYSYMNSTPGTFALTTNCAEWALQGMRAIGLRAPSNLTTFGFTDPAKIMKWDGNN